jgi:hypothetical protein
VSRRQRCFNRIIVILGVLLVSGSAVADAAASKPRWNAPASYVAKSKAGLSDNRPLSNPSVVAIVSAADQVWVDGGYERPCDPSIQSYVEAWPTTWANKRSDEGVLARATIPALFNGECAIMFDRALVGRLRAWTRPSVARPYRYWVALDFCRVAVHERGHNLGYGHVPGVLGDTMEGGVWDERYPACVREARRIAGI